MGHEITDPGEKGQKVKCLSCGSPSEGFFCIDCHTLLPLSEESDYFTLLEVEKRPVVDLKILKENFLKISEMVHPDKHYNASAELRETSMGSSSLLNKAYSTLRDPKERIRYLVSLETDKEVPVSNRASAETMEFFIEASDVCNEADVFLKKGNKGEDERRELANRLQGLKKESHKRWGNVLKEIEALDMEWTTAISPENRRPLIRKLINLSNELSYLSKLQAMLDEMIIGLS